MPQMKYKLWVWSGIFQTKTQLGIIGAHFNYLWNSFFSKIFLELP